MDRKPKIRSITWRTYIIPLGIIILLFAIAGYFLTDSISIFIMEHMMEDANRLTNNHMSRLSHSATATKIIEELLEEKLIVANNAILKNRNRLNNDFLKELSRDLKVDEIYWYNPTGEIIYSSEDKYLGWQALEGHPVYDFMKSNKDVLIGPMRADTESGIYYKYGYLRAHDGEFAQVGILANKIHELTSKFSTQNFIDNLIDEDNILYIHFLNNELEVISSSDKTKIGNYDLDYTEKMAIEEDRKYYAKKSYGNTDAYDTFLPIYVDDIKIGTLIIGYSLESTNTLIKNISLIVLCLLLLIFLVNGAMTIIIIRKNREIEKLAYYDPLTKFFNKNYFIEFLKEQLINNVERKGALLLVNCSNLNLVKLISGYQGLDNMLVEKANQLRRLNADNTHLFRYSEDSFFIYIDEYKDRRELENLCNKILDLLEATSKTMESSELITIKIGVLEINREYKNVDEVIKNVEIVINKLKELENKRYCFFDESMQKDLMVNEMIEKELRKANHNGYAQEFYIEYQPQIDSRTDKIIGLEALARWKNKELGFVPPLKFIDVAEKRQLIIPLGEWILKTGCEFIKILEDKGFKDMKVAINISVIQLLQDNFVTNLMDIMEKTKINPNNLELEITETGLMSNYDIVNGKLSILREKGVSISLDDFGTGYSSLARLKNLNIDVIKIDKSFIDNIVKVNHHNGFVGNIVSLANQVGLKTIAEGVETQEQKEYLIDNDCYIMQGYLFSKPLPMDHIIRLLERTN